MNAIQTFTAQPTLAESRALMAPLDPVAPPFREESDGETEPVRPAPPSAQAEAIAWMAAIALDRDKAAFASLFRHFGPRVSAYIQKGGATATEAEEVTQETFLTLWRKADRFDPSKAAVSTWIFTIARNKRIDALRKKNRVELDETDPLLKPEPEQDGHQSYDVKQKQSAIQNALATLPEDQAQVIRLSFFEEKTHAEIASALKLPLGTVKSRLRLAFKRVREQVTDQYGPAGESQ